MNVRRDADATYLAELYYNASWQERQDGTSTSWLQLQPEHRRHKVITMQHFLDSLPEPSDESWYDE